MDVKLMNIPLFLQEMGKSELNRSDSIEKYVIEEGMKNDSPRDLAVGIRTVLCHGKNVWMREYKVAKTIKAFLVSLDHRNREDATAYFMEPFFDEEATHFYPSDANIGYGVLIGILQTACWLETEASDEENGYYVQVFDSFGTLLECLFRHNDPQNTSIGVLIHAPAVQGKDCLRALSEAAASFARVGSEPRKVEKLEIVNLLRESLVNYADSTVEARIQTGKDKSWYETGEVIMTGFLSAILDEMPLYLRMRALNGLDHEEMRRYYHDTW